VSGNRAGQPLGHQGVRCLQSGRQRPGPTRRRRPGRETRTGPQTCPGRQWPRRRCTLCWIVAGIHAGSWPSARLHQRGCSSVQHLPSSPSRPVQLAERERVAWLAECILSSVLSRAGFRVNGVPAVPRHSMLHNSLKPTLHGSSGAGAEEVAEDMVEESDCRGTGGTGGIGDCNSMCERRWMDGRWTMEEAEYRVPLRVDNRSHHLAPTTALPTKRAFGFVERVVPGDKPDAQLRRDSVLVL
jgi:hypothetical protein